jgi:hypothetical protein
MVYCQTFLKVHPKYKTSYATIVTGFVVAVPALFLNLTLVTVCVVLVLYLPLYWFVRSFSVTKQNRYSSWKIQNYVNSKFILPVLIVMGWFSLLVTTKATMDFILMKLKSIIQPISLNKEETQKVYDYLVTVDAKK